MTFDSIGDTHRANAQVAQRDVIDGVDFEPINFLQEPISGVTKKSKTLSYTISHKRRSTR